MNLGIGHPLFGPGKGEKKQHKNHSTQNNTSLFHDILLYVIQGQTWFIGLSDK
jgi:hypothetical protein